ncbi:MAG: hypothetical protein KKB37_08650 [Alphaproteobacteria bacterium]|nr:hypothetical protein [Alphaproteobacteria bacterium]
MSELIQDGRIIDIILGLVVIEAIAIAAVRLLHDRGPSLAGIFYNLAAGASLMLALRAALTGQGAIAISLWLAVALVAHIADVIGRFRESIPPTE